MASIFIYNRTRGKCVELSTPRIEDEDIAQLRSALPNNLEGISFASPVDSFEDKTVSEVRVEDKESRVAEYLKSIGNKSKNDKIDARGLSQMGLDGTAHAANPKTMAATIEEYLSITDAKPSLSDASRA